MTIIGRGDLSPRRGNGSLGRYLVTGLVLLLLVGGGYAAYLGLSGGSSSSSPKARLAPCPVSHLPGPPRPGRVHLVVLNGTLKSGLAGKVSGALKHRGFHVGGVGNTPKLITGVAIIHAPKGKTLPAQALAAEIAGATIVPSKGIALRLDIGPLYTALRSPAAASAARAHYVASRSPAATSSGSPSPQPSATCSPTS